MRSTCLKILILMLLSLGLSVPAAGLNPDQSDAKDKSMAESTPDEIIQKFAEKETEFFEAWMNYTYTQYAKIRILSVDDLPVEESYLLVSEVVFKDDGTREIKTLERRGHLRSVTFTQEDEEIINNLNPFALTTKEVPLYSLKYLGKERVDELHCYVFSVKPRSLEGNRLYFEGKIWVDDLDLQVVRTVGKAVPELRGNKFPEFETLRQVIDGKYWFPVWSHADEKIYFPESRQEVRIEETISYESYKKFGSKATIRFGKPVLSKEDDE